jgi:hypothetical protein
MMPKIFSVMTRTAPPPISTSAVLTKAIALLSIALLATFESITQITLHVKDLFVQIQIGIFAAILWLIATTMILQLDMSSKSPLQQYNARTPLAPFWIGTGVQIQRADALRWNVQWITNIGMMPKTFSATIGIALIWTTTSVVAE